MPVFYLITKKKKLFRIEISRYIIRKNVSNNFFINKINIDNY